MNKQRLLEVRKTIIDHQDKFNYNYFCTGDLLNECGAVGCVAGWACALYDEKRNYENLIADRAKRYLELDDDQSEYLFWGHEYNDDPEIDLEDADWKEAIRRIDYLLGLSNKETKEI